jgi:hypothetical protein
MAENSSGNETETQWLNPLVVRRESAPGFPKADIRIGPQRVTSGGSRGDRLYSAIPVSGGHKMLEPKRPLEGNGSKQHALNSVDLSPCSRNRASMLSGPAK